MNNPAFMKKAIHLATENLKQDKGGPFGAVIVKDNEIIAQGVNQVVATHDPSAHAEVMAIRHACARLNTFLLDGCELYTSCEPCPMAIGVIYHARISHIYYATTREDAKVAGFCDQFIYDALRLPIQERNIPAEQLLRNEALKAFELWASSQRKVDYFKRLNPLYVKK